MTIEIVNGQPVIPEGLQPFTEVALRKRPNFYRKLIDYFERDGQTGVERFASEHRIPLTEIEKMFLRAWQNLHPKSNSPEIEAIAQSMYAPVKGRQLKFDL